MRTAGLREGENFIGGHLGSDKMFLIHNDTLPLTNQLGSAEWAI